MTQPERFSGEAASDTPIRVEFTDDLKEQMRGAPLYKKNVRVHMQIAKGGETVVTRLADGREETVNTAGEGDGIVTNPGGEDYIVRADKVASLYDQVGTDETGLGIFAAKGIIHAMPNPTHQEVVIQASWGEQNGGADCMFASQYSPDEPATLGSLRLVGGQEFADTYIPYVPEQPTQQA